MCCSVSNFNIFNTHVGLLSHHTVIIIRLGTLLPGPPGWEYTRMKSILIKILTLPEYNCILGSPDSKVKRMIISPTCQSLQKCISDLYMFPWICCCSVTQLFLTPQTAARQASLSLTMSQSLLSFMSIESMMPSNHLVFSHLLSPPAFNLSHHQSLFQWVSSSHQVAKVLELQLQHQSSQWIFRVDKF